MSEETTFWNGEPCEARRVRVIVGKAPAPGWWCLGLEGQVREAVAVRYGDMRYLLDNEDGSGWRKVTEGRGGPRWPHRSLPDSSMLGGFSDHADARPSPAEPTPANPAVAEGGGSSTNPSGISGEAEGEGEA